MKKLIATLFAALIGTSAMAFDNSASFSDYPAVGGSLDASSSLGPIERGHDIGNIQGWDIQ